MKISSKVITLIFLFLFAEIWAQTPTRVAFLADVHFQDLYGRFSDHKFRGIDNPKTGKKVILRTMQSQLTSTRIFNENYFAFLAALDEIAADSIKIVALPGDFTDDGQAYNLRGLKKILNRYERRYGMSFFITTGNHDPVKPFRTDAGKKDFLGSDGRPFSIQSTKKSDSKTTLITKDIAESGYEDIFHFMKRFGFSPSRSDLFWTTPFSITNPSEYSYKNALRASKLENRKYPITPKLAIPDLSYLAEPVEGIWLLAIDGNTYLPIEKSKSHSSSVSLSGAGNGFNNVEAGKAHLIPWIKEIVKSAKLNHKTLIAFSHYPVLDYNSGATQDLKKLLGDTKWQMSRVPTPEIQKSFSEAGLKLHFAGHMHINDTAKKTTLENGLLVNIQVPSLAAYMPGYKVLTVVSNEEYKIETRTLKSVPHFDDLFPLYEKEFEALQASGSSQLWDPKILESRNYHDFMKFHLQELVRLRFIPSDWPPSFLEKAMLLNGKDLLSISENKSIVDPKNFEKWTFSDILFDLYKFQSADELAKQDIPDSRLENYQILQTAFSQVDPHDEFTAQLKLFFSILSNLSNGNPSDHFIINYQKQSLETTQ